jgi:hypothetical protein
MKHNFKIVEKAGRFRWECACGKKGSWVKSDDRAADNGDRHSPGAKLMR